MDPTLLRKLWSVVEATHRSTLLTLDDGSLVDWLVDQLSHQGAFAPTDVSSVSEYIYSRLSLIRDIARG